MSILSIVEIVLIVLKFFGLISMTWCNVFAVWLVPFGIYILCIIVYSFGANNYWW